jgi:hypothetical protein
MVAFVSGGQLLRQPGITIFNWVTLDSSSTPIASPQEIIGFVGFVEFALPQDISTTPSNDQSEEAPLPRHLWQPVQYEAHILLHSNMTRGAVKYYSFIVYNACLTVQILSSLFNRRHG